MDGQQDTTRLLGVVLKESYMGCCYSGTKESLIASGMFKNKWFPGEVSNLKTINYIEGSEVYTTGFSSNEIDYIRISRHDSHSKRFHAMVIFSDDFIFQREKAKNFTTSKKEAIDLALSWINGLPENEGEFRRKLVRFLEACIGFEEDGIFHKRGGYSMSAEAVKQYKAATLALSEAITNGNLIFNQKEHVKERIRSAREAFDRHLARYFTKSERKVEFLKFNAEIESLLSPGALNGIEKEFGERIAA